MLKIREFAKVSLAEVSTIKVENTTRAIANQITDIFLPNDNKSYFTKVYSLFATAYCYYSILQSTLNENMDLIKRGINSICS